MRVNSSYNVNIVNYLHVLELTQMFKETGKQI